MSTLPPEGYRNVSPYLVTPEAEAVHRFARAVFGAEDVEAPVRAHDGRFVHVAVRIGDSVVMMGAPEEGFPAATALLHVYVDDCDAVFARATAAGAEAEMAPNDMLHGDRAACVRDPAGNRWWIAQRLESVSPEEIARRIAAGRVS